MSDCETERQRIRQERWRDVILDRIGRDPWVTVYYSERTEFETVCFFSALIPNVKVPEVLGSSSWDLTIGEGVPGTITFYSGGEAETKYYRFGKDDGIEPLIIYRDFHGVMPSYVEISEEFRLFHNLFHDSKSNRYLGMDENGDSEEIALLDGESVKIKLNQIRSFLSRKEMHLAVFFDIREASRHTLEELGVQETSEQSRQDNLACELCIRKGDLEPGVQTISRLVGKKLIAGPPVQETGGFFSEKNQEFASFVIGVDQAGNEVAHTCNPKELANYFGANPTAPHCLTPVFFRREVLTKYYANPKRFSVEDGYLRCRGVWGLRMDNNHAKYVVVFLGDLGADLSYKEQLYWRSYNIRPEGGISAVCFRRSFLGEFADADRTDLVFKSVLSTFNRDWSAVYGWPLFKPLSDADSHCLVALHIPLTEDEAEFDSQVLALAKILIESLNEGKLRDAVPELDPNTKGISKLERFLQVKGLTDCQAHIKFMRNLHDLRHGAGHRKGEAFQRAAAEFGLGDKNAGAVFDAILRKAVDLLRYLNCRLLGVGSAEPAQT
ncbi:MAG TPA: hypothetical protein VEC08_05945 [Nitrososphaerales archaeon]|nr:hypothetical protein [Nitrososphaerales archaeon]